MGSGKHTRDHCHVIADFKKAANVTAPLKVAEFDRKVQKDPAGQIRRQGAASKRTTPRPIYPGDSAYSTAHVKNSPQPKWPALFNKHLGILELHVQFLDTILHHVKHKMQRLKGEELLDYELGARGDWRIICQMMDDSREILAQTRCAKEVFPEEFQDKLGTGLAGATYEKLVPELDAKAQALGYDAKGKGNFGRPTRNALKTDDETSRSDLSGSLGSDAEDEVAANVDFISISTKKSKTYKTRERITSFNIPKNMEARCPTGFVAEETKDGKAKSRQLVGRNPISIDISNTEQEQSEIDFAALEVKLQTEIAAGEKRVQDEIKFQATKSGSYTESKQKKRRVSSDNIDTAQRKAKKEKLDLIERKRKVSEVEINQEFDDRKKRKKRDLGHQA